MKTQKIILKISYTLCCAIFLILSSIQLNAQQWEKLNLGSGNTSGEHITALYNFNGAIFACVQDSGVFRSTDNGDTWKAVNNGLYERSHANISIKTFTSTSNLLFTITQGGYLFRTTDMGDTWVYCQQDAFMNYMLNIIEVGSKLYGSSDMLRLCISTDGGLNWKKVADTIWFRAATPFVTNVKSGILVARYSSDSIPFLLSSDSGNNWNIVNSNRNSYQLGYNMINSGNVIYDMNPNYTAMISRSTDEGTTWEDIFVDTLKSDSMTRGMGHYLGSHDTLLVSFSCQIIDTRVHYQDVVMYSTNKGDTWQEYNVPIATSVGDSRGYLALKGRSVFVGTWDGLYRNKEFFPAPDGVGEEASGVQLKLTIEPNPALTLLRITCPNSSVGARLMLCNVLGIEVANLTSKLNESTGSTINFDVSGLPAGVYVARWTDGNHTAEAKVMVAR